MKKIDLDNIKTFKSISVGDKIEDNDFGKKIEALVIRKDEMNFYAAYRIKDVLGGDMINVNTYHLNPDNTLENFGADLNFKKYNPVTFEAYKEHSKLLREVGL